MERTKTKRNGMYSIAADITTTHPPIFKFDLLFTLSLSNSYVKKRRKQKKKE